MCVPYSFLLFLHSDGFSIYHQGIAAGLQRRQAYTKNYNSGEGVIVDESSAMSVSVASIEGQVSVGVSGEEDGAEVDLEGDGLHSAVDTDVPLSCKRAHKHLHLVNDCCSFDE